jgi:hypothetical protein
MENRRYPYPTIAELYAIEMQARRARAAEAERLIVSGARAAGSLVARLSSALSSLGSGAAPSNFKGVRHA